MTSISLVFFFAVIGFLNPSLEIGLCTLLKFTMSQERSPGEDGISKFRQAVVGFLGNLNVPVSHKDALENQCWLIVTLRDFTK